MPARLISIAKQWIGAPEIDTYIPILDDNANIEEAFKLFMYGNFDNGIDYADKSLYNFLVTFKNGIESNANAIDGHAGQSSRVHNLGDSGGDVVGTDKSQILTNKTIENPTFTISSAIAGPNLAPVGSIVMWANNTVPVGWLECNGQSTAAYPALATIVGATVPDMKGLVPVGFKNSHDAFGTLRGTGGSKTSTAVHTHSLSAHVHGDDHRHSGGTGGQSAQHTHTWSWTDRSGGVGDSANGWDTSNESIDVTRSITTGDASADHSHGFTTNYKSEQGHGDKTGGPINGAGASLDTSGGSSAGATNGNLQPYITLKFIIKY